MATASALVVGAVVLVCAGLVAGTLWGPQVLRAWVPTLADDLGILVEPEPEIERLEDGYDGELVRRVAAVAADMVRTALDAPTLDEATAGVLAGLASAADEYGVYLSADEYAALESGGEDAEGADGGEGEDGAEGAGGAGASDSSSEEVASSDRLTAYLEGDVGVLVLTDLGAGASDELAAAVTELLDRGATGFVLDLRDNPGGSLNEAVAAASLFLTGGTVVETVGPDGERSRVYADSDAHLTDAPLAVLVSSGTGGAAEALVAGLQDHARAVTGGTVTAGRGTLQTLKTLSFGGAVAFATTSFVTPDGNAVDGVGLTPDVEVADSVPQDEEVVDDSSTDAAAPNAGSVDASDGADLDVDETGEEDVDEADGLAGSDDPDAADESDGSSASDAPAGCDEALARAFAAVEAWVRTGSRAQAVEAAASFDPAAQTAGASGEGSASDGLVADEDGEDGLSAVSDADASDGLVSDGADLDADDADASAEAPADGVAGSQAS